MKTRLNVSHRDALRRLARDLVKCPKEAAAMDVAYAKAADALRKMIEARFPPKDMLVLKKYDMAREGRCVYLQLSAGGFTEWHFRSDEKCPLVPRSQDTCLVDEETTSAVVAFEAVQRILSESLEKKRADYYSLIACASTFEAVVEIWPEAESLRSQVGGTAIVAAVTPEVVSRIRSDVTARAKAQTKERARAA